MDSRGLTRQLALNSFWLFLARLLSQGLALVFTFLAARALGESGLGRYSFMAAIVLISNVLTTFGSDTLLIRALARSPEGGGDLLGGAVWMQLGLSALLIALILLASPLLPDHNLASTLALRVYSLALLPLAFYTVFSAALRAWERMDLFLLVNLFFSGMQALGALLIWREGGGLLRLAELLLLAQCLAAAAAGWLCQRFLPGFRMNLRLSMKRPVEIARRSWPIGLLAVLAIVYQRLGLLVVTLVSGASAAGWYSAAARPVESVKLVHFGLFGALLPLASRLVVPAAGGDPNTNQRAYFRLMRHSFWLLAGFGAAAALTLSLLSTQVVSLLYGPGFGPAAQALQLQVWSLVPFAYSAQAALQLVTLGSERQAAAAAGVSLASAALVTLPLTLSFGLWGASLAVVLSETFQAVIYYYFLHASPRNRLIHEFTDGIL